MLDITLGDGDLVMSNRGTVPALMELTVKGKETGNNEPNKPGVVAHSYNPSTLGT